MQMDDSNDQDLWRRVQQDDRPAFESIYRSFVEVIFALVFKHIDNRDDAEDVTQDVFLTVWEQRKQIVLQKKIFSYLYSVARYKTFRYNRNKGRTELYQRQWEHFLDLDHTPGTAPEVFVKAEMLRLEANMSKEIEKLPPQMKKIYQLNIEEGMGTAEIASRLTISEHTVKKHLVNIKRRLRTMALRLF
jgi:RNA polymerase sigma-19 factor, ECF subfamily